MQTQLIQAHAFHIPDDIARVRQFLFDTYQLTRSGQNWETRRWEGCFYHSANVTVRDNDQRPWSELIRLWETASGRIVGVANPEGDSDTWLLIHPDFRDLENEMLAWAETVHPKTNDAGQRELYTYQIEGDELRAEVLRQRGYQQTEWWEVQRWRDMRDPVPDLTVAEGYTVRAIRPGDHDDLVRLTDVINAGFGHSFKVEMLANFEYAPSYNVDLMLVAEAPDGSFAAHAGVAYNPETHFATFEPVCTHPDHRRKGLASACMIEGLHRANALGAERALVGTGGSNPANALYAGLGFTEVERINIWRKTW